MEILMLLFIFAMVIVEWIRTGRALKKGKEINRLIREDIERHKKERKHEDCKIEEE